MLKGASIAYQRCIPGLCLALSGPCIWSILNELALGIPPDCHGQLLEVVIVQHLSSLPVSQDARDSMFGAALA